MTLPERPAPRYLLVPKDGIDTLHRDPGESCQMDDTKREETVDETTALALKRGGYVRLCRHCWSEPVDDECDCLDCDCNDTATESGGPTSHVRIDPGSPAT